MVVAVALSGGIDSLVAAWHLKQQGHQVHAIHFITGYAPETDNPHGAGNRSQAVASARQRMEPLCRRLEIPLEVIDCHQWFKLRVVDYFVRAWQYGQTPNPCMVCNATIKFGTLLEHARQRGADCLATGHYARLDYDASAHPHLLKGLDTRKDQSYFLARLTPGQLQQACFPLGPYTKAEVRALAADQGLAPIVGKESQDICFIADRNYHAFLAAHGVTGQPGDITDQAGHILGQHTGLHQFTIGQRRGINIPAAAPYYVVALNPAENRLIVGFKGALDRADCQVTQLQWLQAPPSTAPFSLDVRLRYRHQAVEAILTPDGKGKATLTFARPQAAVTPGQCAVFYHADEVLGSGWIA